MNSLALHFELPILPAHKLIGFFFASVSAGRLEEYVSIITAGDGTQEIDSCPSTWDRSFLLWWPQIAPCWIGSLVFYKHHTWQLPLTPAQGSVLCLFQAASNLNPKRVICPFSSQVDGPYERRHMAFGSLPVGRKWNLQNEDLIVAEAEYWRRVFQVKNKSTSEAVQE